MPRIVRFHEIGGPEVLKLEELTLEEPGAGEIRLKVEAIGLNYAEMMLRRGQYVYVPELPSRIGLEAAGVVDAVGPDVSGIAIGDRVGTVPHLAHDRHGNWTSESAKYGVYGESTLFPAHLVTATPAVASKEESAAIWCPYLTAWGALVDYCGITEDDTVLVTAATSSAGLAAVCIAKEIGATVIATTRTPAKAPFLTEVGGADTVVVTEEHDLAEQVMAYTEGQGFTVAYDPVGGPFVAAFIAAAKPCATIINYGNLYPAPVSFPVLDMLGKRLTFRCHSIFDTARDPIALARGARYISDRMASGALRAIVDRTFPLDDIVEAHRYMEAQTHKGKIVVVA